MKFLILLALLLNQSVVFGLNKSRRIITKNDEVAVVNTALGIATKIILPENPNAVPIIGDLSAFRIELIDKGYAVKPLRIGAKTNLFISTAARPYTVKLMLVNQELADYVVYLSSAASKVETIRWREFKRKSKSDYFTLETKRIGYIDKSIILEFTLKSKIKLFIEPEWFYIFQGRSQKVINSLILSSREIDSDKLITGAINLNTGDLVNEIPASLNLKYQDGLKLDIPREFLWKK